METIEIVRNFLAERIGKMEQELAPEMVLADIGVDSLMLLELLFEFEDRLGIELPKDIGTPKTVGELIGLIDDLRKTTAEGK
jgi:acyl carrier protein